MHKLESLRSTAGDVAQDLGLRLVVLHGSTAGDEPREPEDLDLAVLPSSRIDLVELTNRFIRALAVQEVDVTDLSRADPLVLVLVARQGIPLYEAEPGTFAEFSSLAMRRFADTRKFRAMERSEIEDFIERSAV